MGVQGTDVSSNQHGPARLDWHAAKAAGVEFVMVKATQGATYRNPFFDQDIADARAAGLAVGAYHWVSPSSAAQAQAANFLATVAGHITAEDLPCGLDFEEKGASHAQLDGIRAGIRAEGLRTMTYTYPAFWAANGNPACRACGADPLWWASPSKVMRAAPAPWASVAVWQYAGTSVPIPGIGSAEDANLALVPLTTLTGQPPAPAPAAPEEDDMPAILMRAKGDGRWYHVDTTTGTKEYVPSPTVASEEAFLGMKTNNGGPFVEDPAYIASLEDITPGGSPKPEPVKE